MSIYQELEDRIRARGVRVTERLQLLIRLQEAEASRGLADLLMNHQRVIDQAADQVMELLD